MGGMQTVVFASKHPEVSAICIVSSLSEMLTTDELGKQIEKWRKNGMLKLSSSKYGEIEIPFEFAKDAQTWKMKNYVGKIKAPKLFILGLADTTVPPQQTEKLFKQASKPKHLVKIKGMDHFYKNNNNMVKKVNDKIVEFLTKELLYSQTPNLSIRKATVKDLESIIDIQKNDGFKHAYYLSKQRLGRSLKRGEVFYIATLGNRPVGFISTDYEIRAKLHFLSLRMGCQRVGIGTKLLTHVLKESWKKGYGAIYVYVEIGSPAEKFLMKNGFEKVGTYHDRYKPGRHAHILEKTLQSYQY